jgi:hypothetical protein
MKYIVFILLCCSELCGYAQPKFPLDYFRNPLDIPISLAGNFGECRPNHFHTGIDIKTNGQENLTVRAAADGYVSRVAISHNGYGNVVYITHPNGFVTVYAHLNNFYPALQQFVKSKQYELESWALDVQLSPNQFSVSKGQFIAYSGNTGGSTAPHLHFEIRDAVTEHVLNASLFGLPIKDTRPPDILSLAIYDADYSIYEQKPTIINVMKKNSTFSIPSKLSLSMNALKIGVLANDFMEGSTNTLGVYEMELYLDGKLEVATRLEEIDFSLNRYVNAFADYKMKELKNQWYQGLFRLKGNRLPAYTTLNANDGAIDISDGATHSVKIVVRDAFNNESSVAFSVQNKPSLAPKSCANLITTKGGSYQSSSVKINLDGTQLYDDICLNVTETPSSKEISPVVQIHDAGVPLHHYTPLSIKLNKPLPFSLRTKLVFVHHIKAAALPGNNPQTAMTATYENGWAVAPIRTFGNYYVAIDTIAPEINIHQIKSDMSKAKSISFTVSEKMTSVKSMRAEIDGKWICFARRGNTYTYTFDEHCGKGKHQLEIKAIDENDNIAIRNIVFNR